MSIPKHVNPSKEKREAKAPYNFIPLPEKVIAVQADDLPDQGFYHSDLNTGYLDCELTTSSPVFVRTGLTPEQLAANKESKDLSNFFYLNDKNQPVIPGSSLRGMLRTLVEIVTFSKIGAVSKSPLVYRSVGGTTNHDLFYRDMMMEEKEGSSSGRNMKYYVPRIRGGYMVQRGSRDWAIRPAKNIAGTTYAHIGINEDKFRKLKRIKNCQNAYDIYIKPGPYQFQEVRGGFLQIKFSKVVESDSTSRSGLQPAALVRSGWMNSKKSEAVIFEPDMNADLIVLTDEQIDAYREQVSKEQEKLLGKNGVLNDGQPVFYVERDGSLFFFGHSRMFRVPYPNSPFKYIPEYARPEEEPHDPNVVDFAEALFGYTRKVKDAQSQQRAYAGRVSCTDAILKKDQNDIWLSKDEITPKILASPKPTTFQHYLVQQEPDDYEISKDRNGNPKYETQLSDYNDETPGKTVLRGHKFYWHKGQVGAEDIRESGELKDNDTQHTRIRPLKSGVSFKFKIRFENLRPEELGALTWVLNIAADEHIRLKIGMGKPLGMGAVQIQTKVFQSQPVERYASLVHDSNWSGISLPSSDLAGNAAQKFLDMMNDELGSDFMKHQRIRALLIMLQWPGPNREATRYMEIEHPDPKEKRGKRNEYKERPVLPTPFGVWSKNK